MRLQRTIKQELTFEGMGLHTGKPASVRLRPASRNTGIVFYRSDRGVYIRAHVSAVSDTTFATTLGYNGTSIKTVEHILAAATGLGIDNLIIEVNGPEVPILDGSSSGFVESILAAGMARQASGLRYFKVVQPLAFREGHTEILALPYEGRRVSFRIFYDHHLLGAQEMSLDLSGRNFAKEIAPARTFGFLKDVEYLRARGLAQGGSLENAVIIGDNGVLNASGLRFKDELIRHKILDFMGDLALCGTLIEGHFIVNRSGHTTNIRFLKKFLSSPWCWKLVSEAGHPVRAIA